MKVSNDVLLTIAKDLWIAHKLGEYHVIPKSIDRSKDQAKASEVAADFTTFVHMIQKKLEDEQ